MSVPVDEPVISPSQKSQRTLDDPSQDNAVEKSSPLRTISFSICRAAGAEWPAFSGMPRWLRQELRSDHAGEYGAVMIYRGVLAISRDAQACQFAERHLLTEARHLKLMEEIVPVAHRTRLLPLWHVMGWLTGALPALFGRGAIFATIEAVETFVDQHYAQQIVRLGNLGEEGVLRQALIDCQADEVSHRDEAAELGSQRRNLLLRLWCAVVGAGSAAAVVAAKRI
jgi:ubiquinone biosynthesis monooxygenase Coq7